jgi:Recombination endonuclease VII
MANGTCSECDRPQTRLRRGRCRPCIRRRPHPSPQCVGCGATLTLVRGQRTGSERCADCRVLRQREVRNASAARMRQDPERVARYREYMRTAQRRWKDSDVGRFLNYAQNYRRNSGIAITWEEMAALMDAQNHRCAICQKPIQISPGRGTVKNAHLDHCHTTMQVRGWLCSPCNRALGMLQDDPAVLRAAADYLEAPPALRGS